MRRLNLTRHRAKYSLIILWFIVAISGAQELPRVIGFSPENYRASNQNWDITEDQNGFLYIANLSGLLQFDGCNWHKLPGKDGIIRSVAADDNNRIFIGGFETFGYYHVNQNLQWNYVDLVPEIPEEVFSNQEIWKIIIENKKVYFQSFSQFFIYDYDEIKSIQLPGNISLASKSRQSSILIPVIDKGIYRLVNDKAELVEGTQAIATSRVATIIDLDKESLLIGTKYQGLFLLRDDQLLPWKTPINEQLKTFQLNKAIHINENLIAFGTILNGLYLTDKEGNIKHHFNQSNTLQNNTVLSLFLSKNGELWSGLDRGIDQIFVNAPLLVYKDPKGVLGTIYAAAIYKQHFYLGTNQGVFYRPLNNPNSTFTLVPGSQGHVWDLKVVNDQLWCGHNKGFYLIKNLSFEIVSANTGTYHIQQYGPDNLILLATYRGLFIFNQDGQLIPFFEDFEDFSQGVRKVIEDQGKNIWSALPYKGLIQHKKINEERWQHSTNWQKGHIGLKRNTITQDNQNIYLSNIDGIFQYDYSAEDWSDYVPPIQFADFPVNRKLLCGVGEDKFFIESKGITAFIDQTPYSLPLRMVSGQERIQVLEDSVYLFCLEDGYAILDKKELKTTTNQTYRSPIIHSLLANNIQYINNPKSDKSSIQLPAVTNDLKIYFAYDNLHQTNIRYRLTGFDQEWQPLPENDYLTFIGLSAAQYHFEIKDEVNGEISSLSFEILPRWYQTNLAKALALCLVLSIWVLGWSIYLKKRKRQEANRLAEQQRTYREKLAVSKNELLSQQIKLKTQQLADSTMNLVRKNEMLNQLKNNIDQIKKHPAEEQKRAIDKLLRQVDRHLSSDDEWAVFESNFNQLHHDFFKRLKKEFSSLSSGDLRLAAYLKMNLTTKDIAPLLNISPRGVENKRYRLRRKINLDSDTNLTDFMMNY